MAVESLSELAWDNTFTRELAADPSREVRPRQVVGAAFSWVDPTPTESPSLLAFSAEMIDELGLDPSVVDDPQFVAAVSGNTVTEAMAPFAMCYGGHQFGNWAGQLGDGRAIALGEVVTEQTGRQMLQLKGAGLTPYSRTADGLAVLRSSIREFLCSEAMHHLGVPTTRALSLCLTGEKVMRDMFYDGRPALEPGAVVCRVAPSFIRFGSFEIFAARGDLDSLRSLADYTIRTYFPELGEPSPAVYAEWFHEIVRRTVEMVVHWQRVGFVHGVMNTDNMSIHGLTIDYGPYGWLEDYDPGWTPNTTDREFKRYRYGAQPHIAQWNCERLANAIYPLIDEAESLQQALDSYVTQFNDQWARMMADKLGLVDVDTTSQSLIEALLVLLPRTETDMTIFFRALADVIAGTDPVSEEQLLAPVLDAYYRPEELIGELRAETLSWLASYRSEVARIGRPDAERSAAMNRVNPRFVLRNALAQLAIDAAEKGEHQMIGELLDVLRHPYDDQPGREKYAGKRPDWARTRAGCSMLSCSS